MCRWQVAVPKYLKTGAQQVIAIKHTQKKNKILLYQRSLLLSFGTTKVSFGRLVIDAFVQSNVESRTDDDYGDDGARNALRAMLQG